MSQPILNAVNAVTNGQASRHEGMDESYRRLAHENKSLQSELVAIRAELARYQHEPRERYPQVFSGAVAPTALPLHSTSPTREQRVLVVATPTLHSSKIIPHGHLPPSPLSLESTLRPWNKVHPHSSSDEVDALTARESERTLTSGLKHRKHTTPLPANEEDDGGRSMPLSSSPQHPHATVTPQRHLSHSTIVRRLALTSISGAITTPIAPHRKDSDKESLDHTDCDSVDMEASVAPHKVGWSAHALSSTSDTVRLASLLHHPTPLAAHDRLEPATLPFLAALSDRAGWLVGLLVLQSLSSFIIARNETLLQHHLVIVRFLTMLVGAGGNAGNQASVGVIRGLATGAVQGHNVVDTIRREVYMAVGLSFILGVAGALRAALFATPATETVAITICLVSIVFISIVLGTILPLLMKCFRIDPAHSSTTIQVIMDILGVLITVQLSGCILDSALDVWITRTLGR